MLCSRILLSGAPRVPVHPSRIDRGAGGSSESSLPRPPGLRGKAEASLALIHHVVETLLWD